MKDQKKATKKRHVSGIDDTPQTKEHFTQAGLPAEIGRKMERIQGDPPVSEPGIDPMDTEQGIIDPNKP